jgi:hypothetical protein
VTEAYVDKWSPREEQIITSLMAAECVSRIRAIHAMRRRRLDDLEGRTLTSAQVQQLRRLVAQGHALTLADVFPVSIETAAAMQATNSAIRKGGRPRKYLTDRERETAKRRQNAIWAQNHRERRSIGKNPLVTDSFHVSTKVDFRPLAIPTAGEGV